ncbi:hypothetical protein [Coraliomargarita akajimensis]|uniref:Uncharacterized protein n=1 Tax=Coraliomargarita akajimensis (strain DSM 45221 / IAM 15411 / JCM 23193 / KCTC 12865 / 04OKA010-24) TaxID=583355 RepID=D5EJ58_CORAD|nr:hypothetical protein [Coraliomargarita akajimensis]ADE54457.1 hypothetical protein Caka_1438 [Coraliomargarita akajimensis DSM 45221]
MTNERFKDLVNLYLDREINPDEMELLQSTIRDDADRRREFDNACRLHQAMRSALCCEVARNEANSPVKRTHCIFYAGMAASFVLGGVLLAPVLTQSDSSADAVVEGDELVVDLQEESDRYQHYLATQQAQADFRACGSLAARLRLLGLQPSLVPVEPLVPVGAVEVQRVVVEWDETSQTWLYYSDATAHMYPQRRNSGLQIGGPFRMEAPRQAVQSGGTPVGFWPRDN